MRGTEITSAIEREASCANCLELRFLQFQEITRLGRTGMWFCAREFRKTGAFTEQTWDQTCDDFKPRRRPRVGRQVRDDGVPVVSLDTDLT